MRYNKSANLKAPVIGISAVESRVVKTVLRRIPPFGSEFTVLGPYTKAVELLPIKR